ncbi:heterokaryon incompatibility protein-domain-containing protein [Pestalotiopsis sp. NC0098]|nr:heterokaryon incompatibility protein-domain-containing protein [Pestalotiopsis sp. NC0098]
MRRLLRWMESCDKNHDECKVKNVPKLPDRYLDLGADFDGPVKLKESSGETGSYICLSYSWGREPFLRTTADNFGDHQRGIPLQQLPQLFRDLVTIARTLKIRYMWIDALCIIQQDPKDWEEQSVRMLSVYRNAYLTVASVSTTTPNDSCFFTTDAITRVGPIEVSAISHFHRRTRDDEANFPMLLRAWTYQERHISQRELIWDCFHHRTCFCERPSYLEDVVEKKDFHQVILRPNLSDNPEWRQENLWRRMVIQYSQLHLTLRSDKLRALDGLADVFRLATNNTYVAGLWRETLPIDLCWISETPSSGECSSSYRILVSLSYMLIFSPPTQY